MLRSKGTIPTTTTTSSSIIGNPPGVGVFGSTRNSDEDGPLHNIPLHHQNTITKTNENDNNNNNNSFHLKDDDDGNDENDVRCCSRTEGYNNNSNNKNNYFCFQNRLQQQRRVRRSLRQLSSCCCYFYDQIIRKLSMWLCCSCSCYSKQKKCIHRFRILMIDYRKKIQIKKDTTSFFTNIFLLYRSCSWSSFCSRIIILFISFFMIINCFYYMIWFIYWFYHHVQCYSREMGIQWTEGSTHSMKRQCPESIYYFTNHNDTADEIRTMFMKQNTIIPITTIQIDPSRICITSLSDSILQQKEGTTSTTTTTTSYTTSNTNTYQCRDFSQVQKYTWPITMKYCKKHGYTCFDASISTLFDVSRPPAWSKIKAVQYMLQLEQKSQSKSPTEQQKQEEITATNNKQCEWVLWMDADTIIMNSNIKIETILPPPQLQPPPPLPVTDHQMMMQKNQTNQTIDLLVTYDRRFTANSGVWLIRNTNWSQTFLVDWWNSKHFVRPKGFSLSGDNDAFGTLINQHIQYEKQMAITNYYKNKNQGDSEQKNVEEQYFDMTNLIKSGPIRMIPRCMMNSFGVFVPTTTTTTALRTKVTSTASEKNYTNHDPDSSSSSSTQIDEWYMSDKFYHAGDFIAHASGIDKKEDGIKLLLQRAT